MFEQFAAEYGWSHDYILDYITPSQFKLYSELLLCRLDDEKMERQELSIIQGGGNIKEFRKNRRSMRDMIKGKARPKDKVPIVDGPTRDNVKNWFATMGGSNKVGLK
jgi:hypothetical protein